MKKIFLLITFLFLSTQIYCDIFKGVDYMNFKNGLTAILKKDSSVPVVSIYIWVKVGSINEKPRQAGLSHFIEHLVFKGTENYPGNTEIMEKVEKMGGYINAATSKEYTCFYVDIQKDGYMEALKMLADMVTNPLFPEKEIEPERKVVIEEIHRHLDNPQSQLFEKFMNTTYKTAAYKNSVIGTEKVIANVSREEIVKYFKQNYVASNMVVAVVGDINVGKTKKLISKTLGQNQIINLQDIKPVVKKFLKAPLDYVAITSRYSKRRYNPILKCYRAHEGTDYAAPMGTPVYAVGDGVIREARYVKGFGNHVVITHSNGYETHYSHLSKYGKGIEKDAEVKQMQIIGYVGATGRATGPHLDFRISKDGIFFDYLAMERPTYVESSREIVISLNRAEPKIIEKNHKGTEFIDTGNLAHAYMLAGFLGPDMESEDIYVADVALNILGYGKSSRLNKVLKEDKGLVYSINSSFMTLHGTGSAYISLIFDHSKYMQVKEELINELEKFAKTGPTEEELNKIKTNMKADWLFNLQTFNEQASSLGFWSLFEHLEVFENYLENIDKVTVKDVKNFMRKYYSKNKLSQVAIFPK